MAQNKILYSFGKVILWPVYKLLYRFKVKNKNAIPAQGGVILASNHMSFADPVLLGLGSKKTAFFYGKVRAVPQQICRSGHPRIGGVPC